MILTSSWFTPLPPGHVRIGISRGVPPRVSGYRMFRALQPGAWFRGLTAEAFVDRYAEEVLGKLDPHAVADQLHALAGDAIPVLVCWERRSWCHRALVAEWLAGALGERVDEIAFEGAPRHPLAAPPRVVIL